MPTPAILPNSGPQVTTAFPFNGGNYTPNGTVSRFITLPNGTTQSLSDLLANGSGQISWQFTPSCSDAVGTYTLWAKDLGKNQLSNTVNETVTSNPACAGPVI